MGGTGLPRTKKAAGATVDRRNGRRADLSVVTGGRFDPPAELLPEGGLLPESRVQWDAYWDDVVASVQTPVDRAVLLRWITNYDRYLRLVAEADREPVTEGSTGQQIANPLYKIAYQALGVVESCEKQMGVGALNRSTLGIAVIAEKKSLADMNARYGGGDGDSDRQQVEARPDPRVIEGRASG